MYENDYNLRSRLHVVVLVNVRTHRRFAYKVTNCYQAIKRLSLFVYSEFLDIVSSSSFD